MYLRKTTMLSAAAFLMAIVLTAGYVNATMFRLPVQRETQKGSTCWATSGVAILGRYEDYPDERSSHGGDTEYLGLCVFISEHIKLAHECPGESPMCDVDCCDDWNSDLDTDSNGDCDHTSGGEYFEDTMDHYLSSASYSEQSGELSTGEIYTEIVTNHRPFTIYWDCGSGAHYLVGCGYDSATGDVYTMNPWSDANEEGGYWQFTYSEVNNGGDLCDEWTNTGKLSSSPSDEISIITPPTFPDDSDTDETEQADAYYFTSIGNDITAEYYKITSTEQTDFWAYSSKITLKTGFRVVNENGQPKFKASR